MLDNRLPLFVRAASLAGGLLIFGACNELIGIEGPTHLESSGGGGPGGGGAGAGTTTTTTTATQNTGGVGPGGSGGIAGMGGVGGTGGTPDPICGNGIIEGTEQCDNGGENSNSGKCLENCRVATCGDGYTETTIEECDDGPQNSDSGACLMNCLANKCGDGKMHAGVEVCDDGNSTAGDGCYQCKLDCGCPGCTAGTACKGCDLNGPSAGSVAYQPAGSKHCYSIDPLPLSWAAALTACQAKGGSLAALSTTTELNDVLKPEVAAVIEADASKRGWIGANDIATEGSYQWSNGEPFTYALGNPPWAAGEPAASEDCANLGNTGAGYTLRGFDCGVLRPFLCEKTIP